MASPEAYVGQRRSYSGALCTVRYQGTLSGLKGEWLGVEWDDPVRGKHDGSHEGKRIFECLSPSTTAASFLRASRKPDPERTLLEAIKFKYAPSQSSASETGKGEPIEISGKLVEKVGFERIQQQLSTLTNLKIALVDELVVSGVAPRGASRQEIEAAQRELERTCPNIEELDVGWNVVETWQDVLDVCEPFGKLKILKTSGLRLREFEARTGSSRENPFQKVQELELSECLIRPEQVLRILSPEQHFGFPSLKTLSLSLNELDAFTMPLDSEQQCLSVTTLILDNNKFTDLSSLPSLISIFPNLTSLSLQANAISRLNSQKTGFSDFARFDRLETLNLAGNKIDDYSFIDALPTLFPNLTSLRVSRNPLYEHHHSGGSEADVGGEHQSQPPQTGATSDSTPYYLTLARIPRLKSLNYTTVTPREREEGEIYYLSVTEKAIKALLDSKDRPSTTDDLVEKSSSSVVPLALPPDKVDAAALLRQRYPLYAGLCANYDRDDIIQRFLDSSTKQQPPQDLPGPTPTTSELETYGAGTLGSRLVDAYFYVVSSLDSKSEAEEEPNKPPIFRRFLPTTISVYRLKSLIARHFALPALRFRLVYESHEYDPAEPISRTTRATGNEGGGPKSWESWGDWDVDDYAGVVGSSLRSPSPHVGAADEQGLNDDTKTSLPVYITRDGQRFKKRETEILDGMRPWGDFLDTSAPDGSRRRDVKVRVEPL